ncbi:cysteine hydrolase family protein [Rhizobiaceae bacterium n13]|uniref:Cysteine hydrolase family protein n=1 Tax=Ferirhizobium litorale TaxID=2927786 RepID=A0AAE3QGR3_9HYPH|nr:cysteine hydrolase family protein [Fererhizobium litorale]MDI7865219.1 cysteine hydrolase family protein [Fererhizobium litorale]MDI7922833.1 cysteine hydrolase family protein [Fererhizobium litorale]
MDAANWVHLCVDMQRLFAEDTPWQVHWMTEVSEPVVEVSSRFPERTVFTRFIPPSSPYEMPGMWQRYYEKWPMMTSAHLVPEMINLVPALARLVPPARIFDKSTYSPWITGRLHAMLSRQDIGALVVTGGETDVCVLAATLGAIDLGYKVTLLKDAVCSGSDPTHDATLELLGSRFSVQLEITSTDAWLSGLSRA